MAGMTNLCLCKYFYILDVSKKKKNCTYDINIRHTNKYEISQSWEQIETFAHVSYFLCFSSDQTTPVILNFSLEFQKRLCAQSSKVFFI